MAQPRFNVFWWLGMPWCRFLSSKAIAESVPFYEEQTDVLIFSSEVGIFNFLHTDACLLPKNSSLIFNFWSSMTEKSSAPPSPYSRYCFHCGFYYTENGQVKNYSNNQKGQGNLGCSGAALITVTVLAVLSFNDPACKRNATVKFCVHALLTLYSYTELLGNSRILQDRNVCSKTYFYFFYPFSFTRVAGLVLYQL